MIDPLPLMANFPLSSRPNPQSKTRGSPKPRWPTPQARTALKAYRSTPHTMYTAPRQSGPRLRWEGILPCIELIRPFRTFLCLSFLIRPYALHSTITPFNLAFAIVHRCTSLALAGHVPAFAHLDITQ